MGDIQPTQLRAALNKKSEDEIRAWITDNLTVEESSGMPGGSSSKMSVISWLIEWAYRRVRVAKVVKFVEEELKGGN